MASYLLVIGDREALGWILSEGRTAFPSATRPEVSTLDVGDELFLYTTRSCFKNPTRDRGRVIGTCTVTTPVARLPEPIRFGDRKFPVGCELAIGPLAPFGKGVELRPLVKDLDAFGRSTHAWSIPLRRPLLKVSDADADLLATQLATVMTGANLGKYTRWYQASA